MTLQQLHQVITIADSGSMNEAAKKLFISQPSLSATVKELEQEIGFNLFVRSNRGIIITPEGEEFLGYARQVDEQYRLDVYKRQTRTLLSLLLVRKTDGIRFHVF